jgi:hypothetical protein
MFKKSPESTVSSGGKTFGKGVSGSGNSSNGAVPIVRRIPGIGVVRSERPLNSGLPSTASKEESNHFADSVVQFPCAKSSSKSKETLNNEAEASELKANERRKRLMDACLSSDSEDDLVLPPKLKKRSLDGSDKVGQRVVLKGFRSVSSNMKKNITEEPLKKIDKASSSSFPPSPTFASCSSPNVLPQNDVACPVCHQKMPEASINAHLDQCLS